MKIAAGLAVAALTVAQPAQAAMKCWDVDNASAAKVRDLQSRLMVASLRCRVMGIDVLPSYNKFVRVNKVAIQGANDKIKKQFAAGYGVKSAQFHYDKFTTSLANAYGADPTNREICQDTRRLADDAADANGRSDQLVKVADRVGRAPSLPGGTCPARVAAKRL